MGPPGVRSTEDGYVKKINRIPLIPETVHRLSEETGVSQAQLEVRLSQANDNDEVLVYTIVREITITPIPKKEYKHGV